MKYHPEMADARRRGMQCMERIMLNSVDVLRIPTGSSRIADNRSFATHPAAWHADPTHARLCARGRRHIMYDQTYKLECAQMCDAMIDEHNTSVIAGFVVCRLV
jgi:hypothetical protein